MDESPYSAIKRDVKELKYWIKEGASVSLKSNPYREMVVDRIIRQEKKFTNWKKEEVTKLWTIGVECHWIDDTGTYQKGRFFTNELKPFDPKNRH